MQNINTLSELVLTLMNNDYSWDMGVIEAAINGAMVHLNLRFLPNFNLSNDIEMKPIEDNVEAFFFDKINVCGLDKAKVDLLIGLCIA